VQLDFLNPITLVIGKSIFGSELKKARLISIDYPLPSQRGSNRNTEQLKGWAATFARHLNVELSFATESEFMLKPSEIIEFSKYRTTFYSGHHVILTGSDSYCALGFESQKEFRVTKKRLEHAWNKTIFKVGDYVYGIKLSTGRKQFENNPSSIDLDLVELKDWLISQPNRLDAKIGLGGSNLSGGQKQRILIARALYKNPQFLIFDEATNSLDTINEQKIVTALEDVFRDKTVIVVAHRLSTIRKADQIVVMRDGMVAETGTHDSLMKQQGRYYQLVQSQVDLSSTVELLLENQSLLN
jgi:hypothetical protein